MLETPIWMAKMTSDSLETHSDAQRAKSHNVASFVLRFTQELWRDVASDPHVRWRGQIRHVQNDVEERFTDFAEAVAFIQRNLTHLTVDTFSGEKNMSQEKVFEESFKLWEQFATSYSQMMVGAMEQTLKQTEVLSQQIGDIQDKTLQAFGLSGSSADQPLDQAELSKLMATIFALQTQVVALSERIARLEAQLGQERVE